MRCLHCQHDNPVGARFCEQCGRQLLYLCQACGAELSATARFCRACGTPVPSSGGATNNAIRASPPPSGSTPQGAERRQLTVLFCDLVGSTALAEQLDPEALRELMQAYQRAGGEVIARYEGHVAQYLGDGLMVYFGWPHAHEDDAARAIRAALELVDAVSRLEEATPIRARVGIDTGLVVVGGTGHGDASIPKAAVGETPNIAARLQALAEPSCVVVSERTRSLAGGLFDYAGLGAASLKGVSEPVRLFKVDGVRVIESRFDASRSEVASTPLLGRDEEVELLLRRWERVKASDGQVVLIRGEPGIGKSRLVSALREHLETDPHRQLRCQCSPYHMNSALFPVIAQYERSAGFARDDSPDQKLDKLESLLLGSDVQLGQTQALFAAMLSLPVDRYPPLNLSPQQQKARTLEALAGQVEALAQRQPVVVVVEDAHWTDPTTQEMLDLLVLRIKSLPVLLVLTYRPEYTPAWTGQPNAVSLTLSRLNRSHSARLVADLTGGKALPPEVLDEILAHTDGVPLFLEELTKSVLESKFMRATDDRYVLDGPLPAFAIPTTLRDSLVARLDRLAPIREIAQIGACIGREFAYELLAAVSPVRGVQLDTALEQLTGSGLVFQRGTPPDALYTFKHALVQDAAYDSLLKSKRSQVHAQIAQQLEENFSSVIANEPEVLALHFTRAGLHARAVPYWMQAGQRALHRVALSEAVGHLSTALSVNERVPASIARDRQELDIRMLLTKGHQSLLGWPATQVIQALEPARDIAVRLGEHKKLVAMLSYFGAYYLDRSDFVGAENVIEQLRALAVSLNSPLILMAVQTMEIATRSYMGKFREAQQAADRLLLRADADEPLLTSPILNYELRSGTRLWSAMGLMSLGYPDQARQAVLNGLQLARPASPAFHLVWCLNFGSGTLLRRGETRLAREWIAEAQSLAREHAMTFMLDCQVSTYHGWALIEDGDYEEGYGELTRGQNLWRNAGGVSGLPGQNACRARALIALGRFDEARQVVEDALEIINRTGHRAAEAEVHRMLGELKRQASPPDIQGATASYLKSLEVARAQEAKGLELRAASSLASLWRDQDKRSDAQELLAPIYDWFTEGFDTKDLKEAKALLDELNA